jgi:hypothetical protein
MSKFADTKCSLPVTNLRYPGDDRKVEFDVETYKNVLDSLEIKDVYYPSIDTSKALIYLITHQPEYDCIRYRQTITAAYKAKKGYMILLLRSADLLFGFHFPGKLASLKLNFTTDSEEFSVYLDVSVQDQDGFYYFETPLPTAFLVFWRCYITYNIAKGPLDNIHDICNSITLINGIIDNETRSKLMYGDIRKDQIKNLLVAQPPTPSQMVGPPITEVQHLGDTKSYKHAYDLANHIDTLLLTSGKKDQAVELYLKKLYPLRNEHDYVLSELDEIPKGIKHHFRALIAGTSCKKLMQRYKTSCDLLVFETKK